MESIDNIATKLVSWGYGVESHFDFMRGFVQVKVWRDDVLLNEYFSTPENIDSITNQINHDYQREIENEPNL